MAGDSSSIRAVHSPVVDKDQYHRVITFAMQRTLMFIGARPGDPQARRGSLFESVTVVSNDTELSSQQAVGLVKAAKVHVEVIESRTGTGIAVSVVQADDPSENGLTVMVGNEICRFPS
jgi:hypothetical protein